MNKTVRARSRSFGSVEKFIEPCILLLLSKNPSHGYGLMNDLEKHCGEKVDMGNLYRTLRKMEQNKWIVSNWQKNDLGPDKRTYQITKIGKEILTEAVLSLKKTQDLLSRFFISYKKTFGKESIR